MCFAWISEQTSIISLYSINLSVFITEAECLLRDTDWAFKSDRYGFVLKWLIKVHITNFYEHAFEISACGTNVHFSKITTQLTQSAFLCFSSDRNHILRNLLRSNSRILTGVSVSGSSHLALKPPSSTRLKFV
jgi:hypothetical protein